MSSKETGGWKELVAGPKDGNHFVQVYRDKAFLAKTVGEFLEAALRAGEAAIVIARPGHCEMFEDALSSRGLDPVQAAASGQLTMLDAQAALDGFMRDGMPDWPLFERRVGAAIAELRLRFPAVRAYGEMVDILWQDGERDAAIRLEEYWNDLGREQAFSLFCAYYLDNTASDSYGGPLECVCRVHTHFIPAENYERFNEAVSQASESVMGRPLAQVMLELVSACRAEARMPLGQEALLWLHKHMPLTAEKVLAEVRERA